MRRFAMMAAASAVVGVGAADVAHGYRPHDPGCRRRACDERVDRRWAARVARRLARELGPLQGASWFDDSGSTACGFHTADGVANKTLPCGSRVTLCRSSRAARRCEGPLVTVTVEDRGPFVSGREWDLTRRARADLGCGDLCGVRERLAGSSH